MSTGDPAQLFDAYYYATGCGRPYGRDEIWLGFFGGIAERIVREIGPGTVLDAGCAIGLLVETLRERGVEAFGVDLSSYAIEQVYAPVRPFCRAGSVVEPFGQRYDLIVCIEVLEHMPQTEAEAAIANFCRHSDDVLFSSTPFDYREATHFNVQPPEYWAGQFARHGFFRDLDFDASFITPWAVRFRRRGEPAHRIVLEYERRFWQLAKESGDLRSLALDQRDQLAAAAAAAAEARRYAAALEQAVAAKNAHIARLEGLLRRIENGRVMRLLRWLARR